MSGDPALTGFSRVFLIESRARGDHVPEYQSCMKAGGLSQGYGDVTRVGAPSAAMYDKFVEIGKFRGEGDRPTISLISRYFHNLASELKRLADMGCAVDVQIHWGKCTRPDIFTEFTKIMVMEDADITDYSTEDLGALGEDERNKIDETGDISAKNAYEVLYLDWAEVAGDVISAEMVDVIFCDIISCGDCDDISDGCQKIYAISLGSAGGSPAALAEVVYSLDGGATWNTSLIDSLGADEDPSAIACMMGYMVVVSADSCSLHYVEQDDLDTAGDETWLEQADGFVDIGMGTCPLDIWSVGNYAFIAAEGGYIYGTDDPTTGVTILEAGELSPGTLRAVHAIDREHVVVVGSAGVVMHSTNGGETWALTNMPVGLGIDLHCVWMKTETEWWVGTSDGRLLYTLNSGETWTEKAFPGSNDGGIVWDIAFATDSIAYMSHETHLDVGRILRSYDGGNQWVVMPETPGNLPDSDRYTALAACIYDANKVVAVGLAGNATDGIAIVGED